MAPSLRSRQAQREWTRRLSTLDGWLMRDAWTKWVQVEPLKNRNQGVPGQLGYFEKVELAFDSEPVLQAAARMAQTIRKNSGMETVLEPGKYHDKGCG